MERSLERCYQTSFQFIKTGSSGLLITMTTIKTQKQFQNKYRITQLLGEGGYGSVYLCIEISTRVLRAVKILSNVKDSSTSLCPRRYRAVPNEVLILESLSHPNIVRLIDVYRDEKTNSWYRSITLVSKTSFPSSTTLVP